MDLEKHRNLVQQKAKNALSKKSKALEIQLHDEVFACTNCLESNCCTTTDHYLQ